MLFIDFGCFKVVGDNLPYFPRFQIVFFSNMIHKFVGSLLSRFIQYL